MRETEFYEDLLGLPNLKVTSIEKFQTKLVFHCEYQTKISNCPSCLEPTTIINQYDERKVQDLKISEREVWLHIRIPQFVCHVCNRYYFDHPKWMLAGKSYTKRQEQWIFELCKQQSFTEVGALVNLSHNSKRYQQVRKLGIDEIAHRKGKQDYACVLVDLERGIQLDVLKDRKKETLIAHFQSLGEKFCNQIETVSCDIWRTYINVAKQCFPNAEIVIDRFHVVKLMNDVLDKLRKKLRKEFEQEDCFKSIKWKLFKRLENCTDKEYTLLQNAFKKSSLLEEIYELRNTFNTMFDIAKNKEELSDYLDFWMTYAQTLEDNHLNKFIKTLTNWKTQIAAFATEKITNAATEGLNNYLRYFKRISFGLPNFKNMRLRILMATA